MPLTPSLLQPALDDDATARYSYRHYQLFTHRAALVRAGHISYDKESYYIIYHVSHFFLKAQLAHIAIISFTWPPTAPAQPLKHTPPPISDVARRCLMKRRYHAFHAYTGHFSRRNMRFTYMLPPMPHDDYARVDGQAGSFTACLYFFSSIKPPPRA